MSKLERNFEFVLDVAKKYGLQAAPSDRDQEASETSEVDQGRSTFPSHLEAHRTILDKLKVLLEKECELHARRYFADTAHLVDSVLLENSHSMLEGLETSVRAMLDHKNFLLDELCSRQSPVGLPVHVSHHESVVKLFKLLCDWKVRFEDRTEKLHRFDRMTSSTLRDELVNFVSGTERETALLLYKSGKWSEMMREFDEFCRLKCAVVDRTTETTRHEEVCPLQNNSTFVSTSFTPPISSTPYPIGKKSPL